MSRHHLLGSAAVLGVLMLASPAGASETITYSYDAHGRLVKVEHSGSVNNGVVVDYGFDEVDNRTNVTVTGVASSSAVFSIGNASATEGGIVQFTVTKTGTASGTLTVQYATSNGTAGASDFSATSGTLSFAAADTSKTINVQTTQDTSYEGNETFTVTLSNPSTGATIGTATGTGTINEDDPAPPSFAISNATAVTEGGNLVYTVTKTNAGAADVNYATSGGTATSGSDYTATSGTLSFASGDTTKTITVPTTDDSTVESNETVLVSLSGATNGATISDNQGSGTITDNDVPPASFAISAGPAVTEGSTLTYTVTKTGSGAADVSYATGGGTATSGSDYTATFGTLSFASGDTTKTINVPTTDDSTGESSETVQVTLSSPTNDAVITTAQVTNTINDNDTTGPTVSISDAYYWEGNDLQFVISRTGGNGSFSVSFATSDGTATAGSDYVAETGTLNFGFSENSKTITIDAIEDTASEPNELMYVTLSNSTNGVAIGDGTGDGTIYDEDSQGSGNSTYLIADTDSPEGATITFTIYRAGSTSTTRTVNYATSDGTAVAGTDYVAETGSVTFSAGQTSRTFVIDTIEDSTVEPTKTFTVTITPQNSSDGLARDTATGTITNDD